MEINGKSDRKWKKKEKKEDLNLEELNRNKKQKKKSNRKKINYKMRNSHFDLYLFTKQRKCLNGGNSTHVYIWLDAFPLDQPP